MSQALNNLEAAEQMIKRASARIGAMEGSSAPASPEAEQDLKDDRQGLKFAEEVAQQSALRLLQEEVDAKARELLELNIRRAALLVSIHGFLAMHHHNGDQPVPGVSRMISAAFMEQCEDPAAVAASAADWKGRLDALLAS
jgi:hypothetical protein